MLPSSWYPFKGIVHEYTTGAATKIRALHRRLLLKAADRPLLRPQAEIRRLRAQIKAMQEEDRTAIQNAIDVMAENDRLSDYRDFMRGDGRGFLTRIDANALRGERDDALRKADRVGAALIAFEADWREFLAKGTFVGPLPALMKAKPKKARKPKPKKPK